MGLLMFSYQARWAVVHVHGRNLYIRIALHSKFAAVAADAAVR